MNETRLSAKVGTFAAVSLLLLGLLLLSFSKGLKWFTDSYELRLRAKTVAGLKSGSLVLMSGVEVGSVSGADIAPDGRGVIINLKIYREYYIHTNAQFVIAQIGFLGDQYVAIEPRENTGPVFKPGDEVPCEEPVGFQEVVRSTSGLIQRVDEAINDLRHLKGRLDQTILSDQTLTNLEVTFANFRVLSDRALRFSESLGRFLDTNAAPATLFVTNLASFSVTANRLAGHMDQLVTENRSSLTNTLKRLESVATSLQGLATDLEAGQGAAGMLFRSEEFKTNLLRFAAGAATLTSNINRFGLLYRPKEPKTRAVPAARPPRNPFE